MILCDTQEGVTSLNHSKDDAKIAVSLDDSANPYDDDSISYMQPEELAPDQREPFNDAVKHGDIIVGYQRNRTLSDYPRRTRPWVRLYAIVSLVLFAVVILWDIVRG